MKIQLVAKKLRVELIITNLYIKGIFCIVKT